MELTSTEFVLLLPFVVLVYYLIPKKARQYYLILINLLFYSTFGYKYILVVLGEAILAWIAARLISKSENEGILRRRWMVIAISSLILLLLFFKLGANITTSIVAPLGISFYTLQAISYVVDVERKEIEAEKSLVRLIMYLSFFPTITSGPIYRYKNFIDDHSRNITELKPEYNRIINGIIYVIYGYFLKLVISIRVQIAVDSVFADHRTAQYGWITLAVVAILYSIQIYSDFAGYSAIVIGIGHILGYRIPENFKAPYLSGSIREFWGRWHISLSSWLKDYIYIPLGGNRKGRIRKYLNIMITFIISGFWHGANGLHYIVWGALHGLYQLLGDITGAIRDRYVEKIGIVRQSGFHLFIKRVSTFIFVTLAWIFFRTGVTDALIYIREMFTTSGIVKALNGELLTVGLSMGDWILLLFSLALVYMIDRILYEKGMRFDTLVASQGSLARCIVVIVLSLVILIFGIYGDRHDAGYFIYQGF